MTTQINKLDQQDAVQKIIDHCNGLADADEHWRYRMAKLMLLRAQQDGSYSGDCAAYDAAVKRFADAFGI